MNFLKILLDFLSKIINLYYVKICRNYEYWVTANVAQLVEHWLPKPAVAGSNPVIRSIFML